MEYTKGERYVTSVGKTYFVEASALGSGNKIVGEFTNKQDAVLDSAASLMYEALRLIITSSDTPMPQHSNSCYGEVKSDPNCPCCKWLAIRKVAIKALSKVEGK